MKELRRESEQLDERLKRLYAQAARTTTMLDGLPKGSALRSKIEENIVRIQAAIAEEERKLFELLELENRLKEALMPLPSIQRQVLAFRYFDGCSFNAIAHSLRRSVSHIFKLHRIGLKKILSDDSK